MTSPLEKEVQMEGDKNILSMSQMKRNSQNKIKVEVSRKDLEMV